MTTRIVRAYAGLFLLCAGVLGIILTMHAAALFVGFLGLCILVWEFV